MAVTYRVLTEDDWDEWVATGAIAFLDDIENAAAWADPIRPHAPVGTQSRRL